jgi:hypothetical protein
LSSTANALCLGNRTVQLSVINTFLFSNLRNYDAQRLLDFQSSLSSQRDFIASRLLFYALLDYSLLTTTLIIIIIIIIIIKIIMKVMRTYLGVEL